MLLAAGYGMSSDGSTDKSESGLLGGEERWSDGCREWGRTWRSSRLAEPGGDGRAHREDLGERGD